MNIRRYLLLAVALLVTAPCSQIAHAHAVLLDTRPGADSVVTTPVSRIVLRFNEPVRPVVVRVLDATGAEPGQATVRAIDQRIEIDLPQALAAGGYLVSWRVVSADSHPVGGSYRFAVGAWPEAWQGTVHQDSARHAPAAWQTATVLTRAVFLLALFGAAGGVWFLLLFGHAATMTLLARRSAGLAGLAMIAALLLIPLQGGRMLAPGGGELAEIAAWIALARTGSGSTLGLSATVAALAMLPVALLAGRAPLLAAGAASIGVVSLVLTGHAASAEPRLLTAPALALHALVLAFWFGALGPLLVTLRRLSAVDAARVLRRFSRLAVGGVALLALAGFALAIVQVATPDALLATAYGRLLLLKIAVVGGVLLVAWQNQRRLTPALAAGDATARARLIRNIRIEIAAIAAIVLLTGLMGQYRPPRALAADHPHAHHHGEHHHHPAPALSASAESRGHRARLTLSPGRAGHNVLTVRFTDHAGNAVQPLEASVRFALPESGIEAVIRPLQAQAGGFRQEGSDISLPGRWRLRVDALLNEFEKAMFEVEVSIPPSGT